MSNLRIDQFPLYSGPKAGDLLHVYDLQEGLSKKYPITNFISPSSFNIEWSSTTVYPIDALVTSEGKIWKSLQAGNVGNIPTEGAFWTEQSKGVIGFNFWNAGIFTESRVFVFYVLDGEIQLFYLDDAVPRPFESSSFLDEWKIAQWILVSDSSYDVIEKTAHGFLAQDTLKQEEVNGWVKFDGSGIRLAVVKEIIDVDYVVVKYLGNKIRNLAGLTPGRAYYTQPDATLDETVTPDLLLIATSGTTGIVVNGTSGGGDSLVKVQVDTAPGVISIDLGNLKQRVFNSSANITGAKTWSFDNVANALTIPFFRFTISGGGPWPQTMPGAVRMNDGLFVAGVWEPYDPGDYIASASFDGGLIFLKIVGPF